ncbi:ribosomal large subunit pseudouridine synthase D [Oceanicola granulosus HTCC2516]|uniref:Pseudouridine synthase n=1 Tax=Oceanicola granulosus (strain ATCC BAA-861 / DSM 15982 / KCTC 12143 / HTCC2516) TaxID=314256 RepID=Q2CIK5_OCEGH|nr:RluA family pseudouridine synthase [Oceanicola granulosus]EAR52584.1 ribosomal large subunit pseudouridine synthase D [Oceanicola granulosus HTCC2516]
MPPSVVTFRISADPPPRLDKALARDVPEDAALSRSRLARLVPDGAVRINGVVVTDVKARLGEGDAVEIALDIPVDSDMGGEPIPLDVVYEDDELIVINKPAGMVVHPAPGSPDGTLVNALIHHCGESLSGVGGLRRPGIVHRIDKDTSGLLVAAKTDRAHHGLAAQFEAHDVERHYQALCFGLPDAADPRLRGIRGTSFEPGNILKIQTQLARHKTDRQRQAVVWSNGRHAVTRARRVETFGGPPVVARIECWLETGRTHQIRVHMAHAGHGLVGDPVYGGKRKIAKGAVSEAAMRALATFPRQALHAATLGFKHPVTGELKRFAADMPADMTELCALLRS